MNSSQTLSSAETKHILYPPGGLLIWLIIVLEIITFGVVLIVFAHQGSIQEELFRTSRLELNVVIGTLNTLFLLISGFFMASAVRRAQLGDLLALKRNLWLTMAGGLLFVLLKSIEYHDKIEHGLTLSANAFFTFYWLLTGFHLVHVLVGLAILAYFNFALRTGGAGVKMDDLEAGASFWHLCDLIWLLLFPILYLL
jgi:nitric oxide reductase NorE protein